MAEEKNDIAFALNYTNIYQLDITPHEATHQWARIGAGIQNVTPTPNETVSQDAYYDGGGQASSDITGGQNVLAFSGHRRYGDPAQDYIASLDYTFGEGRKTYYRHIAPDGRTIEGACTIANIVNLGGDANAKGTFSFELHNDGIPNIKPPQFDQAPKTISGEAVSVKVGETAQIKITVEPEGAADTCVYGVEDPATATVDADGTVHGVKEGTTKISVKSALLPAVQCVVDVTVTGAS